MREEGEVKLLVAGTAEQQSRSANPWKPRFARGVAGVMILTHLAKAF